jgi:hypothetical protein
MLASEPPILLLMKVRKMDYIDYGMKLKVETPLPKPPEFQTIYISGGKKIN